MMASPPAFTIGANLPWLRYGGDFGANAWYPGGGLRRRTDLDDIRAHLTRLASRGVTAVRWFMLCDGRAGVRFASDGAPLGPDAALFADVDAAEALAEQAGVKLIFVLLDFRWCAPRHIVRGVSLGGHRATLARPALRSALIERVIAPVLERYGRSPFIHAWDLINEPEWVTRGAALWNPFRGVSWGAMRAYIAAAADGVHSLTVHQATVGSAAARWLRLVRGTGLDFYQPHWYDHLERRSPLERPVAQLGLDRPAWLGEFPTRGSAHNPRRLVDAARGAGYQGALFWSVFANDAATLADGMEHPDLDFASDSNPSDRQHDA